MGDNKVKTMKKYSVNVINSPDQEKYISNRDAEMDARAKQAVRTAVAKAEFCKKPVAKYDINSTKVYVEYSDGVKKYVN